MSPALLHELRSQANPGWIFRAGRLLAERGRAGPPPVDLVRAAQDQAAASVSLPPAQVRQELEAILLAPEPGAGLQWLQDTGVLPLWLPELSATVNFSQEAGRRHKDVWEHTKQVVLQAAPRALVRWAALLHDIGKVPTRTFLPDGRVHFHRHAEVGARMFDDIGRRLGFDRSTHRAIRFLILHHLRANQYVETWTDSAVRRFDREMGEYLQDLLDLSRADITSRLPGRRRQALEDIDALQARILALRAEDAVRPPLPSGLGNVIMERFGLPPSRLIGDLKRRLEAAIAAGELEPHREASYYLGEVERYLAELPQTPCLCPE
ncbi:MAG: HD domain-containing protein [Myxococcales bacterium]|nr:HD domain-containing protein [Myxococcota bacterium]MDW8283147.1 HD domain-containing protein [Myxococcales bacterium]